jgi:hypothetical protein
MKKILLHKHLVATKYTHAEHSRSVHDLNSSRECRIDGHLAHIYERTEATCLVAMPCLLQLTCNSTIRHSYRSMRCNRLRLGNDLGNQTCQPSKHYLSHHPRNLHPTKFHKLQVRNNLVRRKCAHLGEGGIHQYTRTVTLVSGEGQNMQH